MLESTAIRTVAVIGAGTIGASWCAWFLARGLSVAASDPDPTREAFVRDYVEAAWPALSRLGLAEAATAPQERLRFATDPAATADGADFVQESAPERLELKQALLAAVDAALPPDRIIASSTSGFGVSALQAGMRHPERLIVGHPFNPVHLVPLVEVVGGGATAEAAVTQGLAFYAGTGKRPIRVRKEVTGHLANRLQAALWREAVHLVAEGIATVEDVDAAVAYGPGIRWASMGPHLTFHLAGGAGGMAHFLRHIGPAMERWWETLGSPSLTPEVEARLVEGVQAEVGARSFDDLVEARDESLLRVLEALSSGAAR